MNNEEIVELIQQGVDVRENMGLLYKQNEKFIRMVVTPFTQSAELDDLMQESYWGLCKAVEGFNPSVGNKFLTYLSWKVRSVCIRYIIKQGNQVRIPDGVYWLIYKHNRFLKNYEEKFMCKPSDQEVMKHLGLDAGQLKKLRKTMKSIMTVSVNESVESDEGKDFSILDTISSTDDVEGTVLDGITKEEFWECLDFLSDKQKQVIEKHYKEDISVIEIAQEFGCSKQQIYSIENKAFRKLKQLDELKNLAEVYGINSSLAYGKGVSLQMCLDKGTSPTEVLVMRRMKVEDDMKKAQQELDEILSQSTEDLFNQIMKME